MISTSRRFASFKNLTGRRGEPLFAQQPMGHDAANAHGPVQTNVDTAAVLGRRSMGQYEGV
jgi:hypothetical protein